MSCQGFLDKFLLTRFAFNSQTEKNVSTPRDTAQHNDLQIAAALTALERALRSALQQGIHGSIGVRVPVQRQKLGNIRTIIERETA